MLETPMTAKAVAELKELGLRFNALDHDPERRAMNEEAIKYCDSIHLDWTGLSFHYLDNRDEAHNIKIDSEILIGKRSFEEHWQFQKEMDEYDYEYEEYLAAKESYERLKDKYE